MSLTKSFKDTIGRRIKEDPKFKSLLLEEAINEFLSGDFNVAKSIMKDYINGAISFEKLARKVHKSDKSLQRMFSDSGNPTSENFFSVIHAIQEIDKVKFEVRIH